MCTFCVVRSKCTVTCWFKYLLTALSVFSSCKYWSLYEENSFSSISSLETLQKNNHIFLLLYFHNEDMKNILFTLKNHVNIRNSFYLFYTVQYELMGTNLMIETEFQVFNQGEKILEYCIFCLKNLTVWNSYVLVLLLFSNVSFIINALFSKNQYTFNSILYGKK
jgi:hypothetical protein